MVERSNLQPTSVDYDAELRLHNEVLREAYGIRQHDHVLDIGCGTGQTTREAALLAVMGSAMGVDSSASMIQRAREITDVEGPANVTFEQGDAEVHRFSPEHFDVVISRFGMMFFTDPLAAFTNIARALRNGGRLVTIVWQHPDRNEWFVSIQRCLARDDLAPAVSPGAAFSLADPTTVEAVLGASGFADVTFTDVQEPVYYGKDVDAAFNWVSRFSFTNDMLDRLKPDSRKRAIERLRKVLASHQNERGVWFDSRTWLVTARRC